ncbi:hypothetical protein TPHV1_370013 [Treponema phagedenis]|uniref:Uncharacterized protein n=1 Tax=Treponema phagedenis TaxID=162 RepID=A0A0B7GVE9_TREPH|nr:hypothetical protein TPHV1_370013 [Treponema phagedenis]
MLWNEEVEKHFSEKLSNLLLLLNNFL